VYCNVPISKVRAAPFNLPWGSHVFANVVATNLYGNSLSGNGNGAVILTNPDAPKNLVQKVELMTPTAIGVKWDEGDANGGAPVTEYRLSYDQSTGVYIVLGTGISSR